VYARRVFLAGVAIPDRLVLELVRDLHAAGFDNTAERLERAWSGEVRVLALDARDRFSPPTNPPGSSRPMRMTAGRGRSTRYRP
jgi:hypothetical protein